MTRPDDLAREAFVTGAMHREFVRKDFLDRLAAHCGLSSQQQPTAEHFASFDAHRRAQHEARWPGERDALHRNARRAQSRQRDQGRRERRRDQGVER